MVMPRFEREGHVVQRRAHLVRAVAEDMLLGRTGGSPGGLALEVGRMKQQRAIPLHAADFEVRPRAVLVPPIDLELPVQLRPIQNPRIRRVALDQVVRRSADRTPRGGRPAAAGTWCDSRRRRAARRPARPRAASRLYSCHAASAMRLVVSQKPQP